MRYGKRCPGESLLLDGIAQDGESARELLLLVLIRGAKLIVDSGKACKALSAAGQPPRIFIIRIRMISRYLPAAQRFSPVSEGPGPF